MKVVDMSDLPPPDPDEGLPPNETILRLMGHIKLATGGRRVMEEGVLMAPSYEFAVGFEAAFSGRPTPYGLETVSYRRWLRGYELAVRVKARALAPTPLPETTAGSTGAD